MWHPQFSNSIIRSSKSCYYLIQRYTSQFHTITSHKNPYNNRPKMITSLDLHSDHWDSIPFRNKIKERLRNIYRWKNNKVRNQVSRATDEWNNIQRLLDRHQLHGWKRCLDDVGASALVRKGGSEYSGQRGQHAAAFRRASR